MFVLEQASGGPQLFHELPRALRREVVRLVVEAVVADIGVGEHFAHAAHRDLDHAPERRAGGGVTALQALQELRHLLGQLRLRLQPPIDVDVYLQQLVEPRRAVADAEHQQGDLAPHVVHEEAHLEAVAFEAQQAHQGVADPGVARPPEVRRRVRVDAGVLHQRVLAGTGGARTVAVAGGQDRVDHPRRQVAPGQKQVQVGTAHFDAIDAQRRQVAVAQRCAELLRKRHGGNTGVLRQPEAGHRVVAHGAVRRGGQRHLDLLSQRLADEARYRVGHVCHGGAHLT